MVPDWNYTPSYMRPQLFQARTRREPFLESQSLFLTPLQAPRARRILYSPGQAS